MIPIRQEVLSFCLERVTQVQRRKDYKEFLEIVIIMLGEIPPGGIKIRQPVHITKLGGWQKAFIA